MVLSVMPHPSHTTGARGDSYPTNTSLCIKWGLDRHTTLGPGILTAASLTQLSFVLPSRLFSKDTFNYVFMVTFPINTVEFLLILES